MQKGVYKDFLELVAFSADEIPAILPQWIMASQKLGLSEEDIRFAIDEWIPKHWDIDLLGVRKMIGVFIRELIDVTRIENSRRHGKKIIYSHIPSITTVCMALKEAGGDSVYVGFPDFILYNTLHSFFNRMGSFLEQAEQETLCYGCRYCAINQTRLMANAHSFIPVPDVIWSIGGRCDEGPKTEEFIDCFFETRDTVIINRLPYDRYWGDHDDEDEECVTYLARSLHHSVEEIGKTTGIEITASHLSVAQEQWESIATKVSILTSLAISENTVFLGGAELAMFNQLFTIAMNIGTRHIQDALDTTIAELHERKKRGQGALPQGTPQLATYAVPFSMPWVASMFREHGVALTVSCFFNFIPHQLRSLRSSDPYHAVAESWLRMPIGTINMGYEVETIVRQLHLYKPDGMLMGFFDFENCWAGPNHKVMARLIEEQAHVPMFYIEGNFWEDRECCPTVLQTRIENIAQVITMNKKFLKKQARKHA